MRSEVKQRMLDLPLRSQVALLAVLTGKVELPVLIETLKAVDLRNAIVHEGKRAYDPGRRMLLAVLACIKELLGLEELKTPVLFAGNMLSAPGYDGQMVISGGIGITDDMSAKDGVESSEVQMGSEEAD